MLSAVSTIPEDKVLKEKDYVTYKLIKVYTLDIDEENYSPHAYDTGTRDKMDIDKSHTQLFYNVTNKTDLSNCTPSYSREVCRDEKISNLYWYKEALKSVPSSPAAEPVTLWKIDPVKIKKSKVLRRIKRPRVFSLNNTEIGCHSVFEYGGNDKEPKGYSGETTTPFDDSSVQRFRWVRYKDGSRWVLIARNDPNTPLAELRKTSNESELEIVFLSNPPPGWKLGHLMTQNSQNSQNFNHSAQFTGRYPSVFSNPSTYRSSTTSGFLTNRESSFSDFSDTSNGSGGDIRNGGRFSAMSGLSNKNNKDSTYSERNFASIGNLAKLDAERYWQEYVLATTVTVQDEVNSNKRRLWK